jgi:hypothetical protein
MPHWEKIQVRGTGDISIQVLDEEGVLISDSILPGNAVGINERTVYLWSLDPEVYPTIRLRATLEAGAILDEWSVFGSNAIGWNFNNGEDLQGWEADDLGEVPTLTAADGSLRLGSTTSGTDPNIQFWFPIPVDASEFTTLEMRLKTSNNTVNDDVTVYWDSNYGAFDVSRSIVMEEQILLEFQTLVFDLTSLTGGPDETWNGQINAIRIDPTQQFVEQPGPVTDGWAEFDYIILY